MTAANAWLDPLRRALDGAGTEVPFFFRDDDVGWADERLWELLDQFAAFGTPIDLAVIPAEVTAPLVRQLQVRAEAGERLGFHQHGWSHRNHEPEGRKWEFGSSRTRAQQAADLRSGRLVMDEWFGPAAAPIFVPPWNRCTATTAELLVSMSYGALSRDRTATPVQVAGLRELPVSVDWHAKRHGVRVDARARGELLASALDAAPVGVMLHHEVLSPQDLHEVVELVGLLSVHPAAVVRPMGELIGWAPSPSRRHATVSSTA
jgi:peptidoglycan/xylan/chitin deacetylase (PgdA/CDA1 family)